MLKPMLTKNDKKAHILIWAFSVIVFVLISVLENVQLKVDLPFNPHVFAALSALVNSFVAILLVVALVLIKKKNIVAHKNVMLVTMGISILFLVFYVLHHLFAGKTFYGDVDHDGIVTATEIANAGVWRTIYIFTISTHIVLAGIVMPFVLYTAYRAMIGEYSMHKKIARWTFPIWLYVAVTGVALSIIHISEPTRPY